MENYVLGDDVLPAHDVVEMQPISNDNGRKTLRSRNDRDRPITVLLSDPDMFDCCICYEPLSIPVFQCDNGHIVCFTCWTKLWKKCAMCSMGFYRCRALENLLQSLKTSCQNEKYGCKRKISYSDKNKHEKKCIYVPCYCPLSGCDFVASSKVLSIHVKHKHEASRIQFLYDHSFFVSLKPEDRVIILQEQTDGKLFILNNSVMHWGYVVKISCIGPTSSKQGYHYDILVRSHSQRWTRKLESFMENVQRGTLATISSNFLGIPFDNFSSLEPLKLEICIRYKDNATHSAEDRRP